MTLTIQEARAQLHSAQAEADKQKRDKANQDLIAARTEGRRLERELKAKVTHFRKAEAQHAELQARFEDATNTLRSLVPDGGEFPSERDLRKHEQAKARLATEREVLLPQRRDAAVRREQLRQDALLLEGAQNRLRFSIHNLEALVRGEKIGGGWEGGLFRVTDGSRLL